MDISTIRRDDGVLLAYEMLPGKGPTTVFLPGFGSDMGGTKALYLREACVARGGPMLRLDYSGHGDSEGKFEDGTIGQWADDAALVIEQATGDSPLLLVGSSMGGWIALLLALRFGARVQAMLLIAPAPDFTERLLENELTTAQREILRRDGFLLPPSAYGPPMPITQKLLNEGSKHLLLTGNIGIVCPIRVLHGMRDADVPWRHSLRLADCLESTDVRLTFIKDGDHRLSRDADLKLLRETWESLLGKNGA